MKIRKKIKVFFSMITIWFAITWMSGEVCYADVDIDALEGYLNSSVIQQEMNQCNNPKYANKNNVEETVDPITGSLYISTTDLNLAGKDGLDLSIGRIYNSSQDECDKKVSVTSTSSSYTTTSSGYFVMTMLYDEDTAQCYTNTIGPYNTYEEANDVLNYYMNDVVYCLAAEIVNNITTIYHTNYTIITKNYPDKYNYDKTRYYLGAGWSFAFPSVEIEKESSHTYMYYHDGTGAVYKITGTEDIGKSNLDSYEGENVKFIAREFDS